MKNLSELIAELMTVKTGNKEFALEFYDSSWSAVIGNTSKHVSVAESASYGEQYVEFYAISQISAEDAVQQLIDKVKA